jgi:uncharacterized membrane protein YfcA
MADLSLLAHLACAGAAAAAGAVNTMAGGGTLISFPTLTALGVPSVAANATNTVALCPGYIGGAHAQRQALDGAGSRGELAVAAGAGLLGSVLLVVTDDDAFRVIVPYLILLAAVLLAVQPRVRAWLTRRGGGGDADGDARPRHRALELGGIAAASIYGGYFGAGLGIMLLAVLGLFGDHSIARANALKSVLAFAVNVAAAGFLAFSGKVEWTLVLLMAPASLAGGSAGGRLLTRIPPERVRPVIVTFAVVVAIVYLVR